MFIPRHTAKRTSIVDKQTARDFVHYSKVVVLIVFDYSYWACTFSCNKKEESTDSDLPHIGFTVLVNDHIQLAQTVDK